MPTETEQIEITPNNSVVPVFLVPITEEEQAERLLAEQQAQIAQSEQESARSSALVKLMSLGLTEEEALAIAGG